MTPHPWRSLPILPDEQRIPIHRPTSVDGNIPAGLHDSIEGTAINHQVFDDRKGRGSPRLDRDDGPIWKPSHVQLAGGDATVRAMRDAVDDQRTTSADTFATIMFECHRLFPVSYQPLIDAVEHFKEGHPRAHIVSLIADKPTVLVRSILAPDVQRESHDVYRSPALLCFISLPRHRSLITSRRRLHEFEGQRLLVQYRTRPFPVLPCRNVREAGVIPFWLAISRLILFAKVRPA
jgi:hypothetical protein